MYRRIGDFVSRYPLFWIVIWLIFAAIAVRSAPDSDAVSQEGELAFLPLNSPSRQAESLFREAFTGTREELQPDAENGADAPVQQDPLGSSIVIVLQRDSPEGRTGLTAADQSFLVDQLLPGLEAIRETTPAGRHLEADFVPVPLPPQEQIAKGIVSESDRRIGALLRSEDEKATLVVCELKTEFLDRQNGLILERVEKLIADLQATKPLGLSLALSGSVTVGRDMLRAERDSASRTETFTRFLVIGLLLAIYRAPLLALVPLVTVGVAVEMTKALLRILAGWGWIGLFTGLDVYVTVVVYGAGVDYCLFLIARYKEELDLGASYREAMARSIHRVGSALATSAGTSIAGIGMMAFSEFGKFRQAGFAISFGLFVVLCFALTFTPAFLLMFGKWLFWPKVRQTEATPSAGWLPSSSLWDQLGERRVLERFWDGTATLLRNRPGTIFMITILLMLPFAGIGIAYQNNLSYGLLTDLPQNEPSVEGAKVVQRHFPAGVTGPITLLIEFDRAHLEQQLGRDLSNLPASERLSRAISRSLEELDDGQLGITDIRCQAHPLGTTPLAKEYVDSQPLAQRGARRTIAHRTYVGLHDGPSRGQVMRVDVILRDDPFSRESIAKLSQLEEYVRNAIPLDPDEDRPESERAALRDTARILPLGTTAGIRDLKLVTDRDRIVIDILVVVSVYILLVMMLRQPAICAYLIVSVAFSYLVALGVTFAVFYLRDPSGFTGIDWKVPVYLFTILIAMGEDYNILLMSRVQEEQEKRGPIDGILYALTRTGSIISSCGVIMAGTFLSLMAGTLLGMVQLGFALAFGVFLDTFIVRPILVPAYLIMLHSGRFGKLGRFLGARPETLRNSPDAAADPVEVTVP